jgi:hypothetical protein
VHVLKCVRPAASCVVLGDFGSVGAFDSCRRTGLPRRQVAALVATPARVRATCVRARGSAHPDAPVPLPPPRFGSFPTPPQSVCRSSRTRLPRDGRSPNPTHAVAAAARTMPDAATKQPRRPIERKRGRFDGLTSAAHGRTTDGMEGPLDWAEMAKEAKVMVGSASVWGRPYPRLCSFGWSQFPNK